MMKCYGVNFGRLEACRACRYRKWCASAQDPALLSNRMASYSEILGENYSDSLRHPAETPELPETPSPEKGERLYTKRELCELVRALVRLDARSLQCLDEKFSDTDVTFARLGRRLHVSRQYVYCIIRDAVRKLPALKRVFPLYA